MKQNLVIKILVLIVAILFWMQQVMQKTHDIEIQVPLKLMNLPNNLIFETIDLPKINVTIKAKGYEIISAKLSKFVFEIEASDYQYGKNLIEVSAENLSYSKKIDLQILNIAYDHNLYVNVDRLVERQKPIELIYTSADDEEFFIENKISDDYQRISLRGPQAVLNNIEAIKTEPINRKMVTDGKITVGLLPPNPAVQILNDHVILNVTQTKIINKTITLIPIRYPESLNITIIPQKVSVMLRGPEEILEKIDLHSIPANLEVDKIKKGFTGVTFELPSGVKLVEYTPKSIQIIENE
ncbi:MAG TPA: CdaR family protein [Candidatus Cloacimonadota bacterium]|nr:CdaR family protein [Candidatus Cloacimonadota bacterium]